MDELCLAARLAPEKLEGGVTHAEGMRLWKALETVTGDACVGLTAGERVSADFMGAIGVMFATAHDLADGLRVGGNALKVLLQNEDIRVQLSERGGEFSYHSVNEEPRHGIDAMFAAILTLSRQCTGHTIVPLAVQLQCARPNVVAPYERLYGVQPAFDQKTSVMRFAVRDLNRKFRSSDHRTNGLLISHVDALLGPTPEHPLARIERAIERAIAQGNGTLVGVAARLEVSPRTLQRELAEHASTFEVLRARVCYEKALERLSEGASVSEVAAALGYGSRTAFSRAFQRWTGTSPMAYAAGLRSGTSVE